MAEAGTARLGNYVTLTGNVVSHLRGDYCTFRDATGEIRVEIEPRIWQVDRGIAGRYLWVKSLEIAS